LTIPEAGDTFTVPMLIYGAIAAFGVLLLIIMLLVGEIFGGDGDHDAAHSDTDSGGPSVVSTRVTAAFFAAFGVGGVVARYYGLSHPASSGVGVVCGLVMATIVYQFAKLLYSQQVSSELQMTGIVGQPAHVTVAIPAGGVGQVAVTSAGQQTEHIARSDGGEGIARGTQVVIAGFRGDAVIVKPAGSTPATGGL
jgi:membrane protein implicated in regulation of membrane protease activity